MQKTKVNSYDKLLNYILSMEKDKKPHFKVNKKTQYKTVAKKRLVLK